jgi:DNA-binding MarR family transcriptional regulator
MKWPHDPQKHERLIRFMQSLNPEIEPASIRLLDEIRHVFRMLHQISEQSLNDAELSHAQYRVLMHLFFAEQVGERDDLNPSEISERHGVSRNTISSLIRSLEDEGLVERRLDPHDRRRFNISLTADGRARVTAYSRHHLATINQCFAALDIAEQETLLQLLRKVGRHAPVTAKG